MAKTSQVNRNKMRERLAARDKGKRKTLKDIVMDRTLPVEGVQFHPEAMLTEHGHAMLKNFLEGRAK